MVRSSSYLALLRCDSLLVAGTTTSGCVRAVVDAFSNNIRVAVAADACFDRFEVSHAINLFDMHAKYADVLASTEIVDYIGSLPDNLFELPKVPRRRRAPESTRSIEVAHS